MKLEPPTLAPLLRRGLSISGLAAIGLGLLGLFDAIDAVSFVLLLAIAWLCRAIFDLRHIPGSGLLEGPDRVWLLMAWGFVYLALDELLSIHEGIDRLVHWLFAMRESALTDRIDDIVVLAYGIAGMAVLWHHRKELALFKPAMRYLVLGFLLLFLMVAVDALTNRMDFIRHFLFNPREYPGLIFMAYMAEELLKIAAEICFVLFFFDTWRTAWNASKVMPGQARSTPG